jgi:hypothetical protein
MGARATWGLICARWAEGGKVLGKTQVAFARRGPTTDARECREIVISKCGEAIDEVTVVGAIKNAGFLRRSNNPLS